MRREHGFSLVELVLFIIVVAIGVGGIMLAFTQGVRESATPYLRQRTVAVAQAYMDEILLKRWDENSPLAGGCVYTGSGSCAGPWSAATPYSAGARVVPVTGNGHLYEALSDGTSGGTEPAWPTDGGTVSDNGMLWRDLGTRVAAGITTEEAARGDYDDIGDYHGLDEAPTDQNGNPMAGYAGGFRVTVEVSERAWQGIDARDARRVTVAVTNPAGETVTLEAYRVNY